MSKIADKDLVLDLGEGKTVNLSEVIRDASVEGMKQAGVPMNGEGKFDLKSINVHVKDAEEKSVERYDIIANFIKASVLPAKFHSEFGVKAIDTTSGSFGSVVPVELNSEIIAQSKRWTIIRQYAFVFQLSGTVQVPQEGTGITAYWVDENVAVTESSPTLTNITLGDNGVATLVKLPWKLLRTSSQNITTFIATLAGKAMTDIEEAAFVNGDGVKKPLGVRQTSGLTTVAQVGASYAYSDLVKLFYSLSAGFRQNAVFVTSGKGCQILNSLLDAQGRPIFTIDGGDQKVLGKILLESEDIPSNLGAGTNETEIYFGDPMTYWIKDGSSLEMASQDVIENLQTKIVLYKYVDGKIVVKNAWRKQTGVK